jgi:transposase
MAKPLLPDELWNRIEPLLPPPKPRRFRYPGRKPIDNRKALIGILFVLKTGVRWGDYLTAYLPLRTVFPAIPPASVRGTPRSST